MRIIITTVDRYTGQTEIVKDHIDDKDEVAIRKFWEEHQVTHYCATGDSDNGPKYYAQVGADADKIVSIIQLD